MTKQQTLFKTETPKIVLDTIRLAASKLQATGCAFKVIMPNGEAIEHDPNNWLNPAKVITRTKKDRPFGTLVKYYRPLVENMKTGDVVELDYSEFGAQELQSAVTAWCCHQWGAGSVTSCKNIETGKLEVLRLK
jgi:hypothetical protein